MSKIALVVEFKIKAGQRDAFLEIIPSHATGTKADEEGCLQFKVLIPEQENDKVILVKMYRYKAALDIHVASPQLQATRAAYGDMIERRSIATTLVDKS